MNYMPYTLPFPGPLYPFSSCLCLRHSVAIARLLNGRCTSLLRALVSEMTYTVSSGTLNATIPYHAQRSIEGFDCRDRTKVPRRLPAADSPWRRRGQVLVLRDN